MEDRKDQYQLEDEYGAEHISTKEIVEKFKHTLVGIYSDILIDGPIMGIGGGVLYALLYLANLDRKFYAVDELPGRLEELERRIPEREDSNIRNWTFISDRFPEGDIPEEKYALIILSDILQMYSFEECIHIEKKINHITKPGSLIYLLSHSTKHPDKKNSDYYKCFFYEQTTDKIFPDSKYEKICMLELFRKYTKQEAKNQSHVASIHMLYSKR